LERPAAIAQQTAPPANPAALQADVARLKDIVAAAFSSHGGSWDVRGKIYGSRAKKRIGRWPVTTSVKRATAFDGKCICTPIRKALTETP